MLEVTPPDLPRINSINLGLASYGLLQIKVVSRISFLRAMVGSQKFIDLELEPSDLGLALSDLELAHSDLGLAYKN